MIYLIKVIERRRKKKKNIFIKIIMSYVSKKKLFTCQSKFSGMDWNLNRGGIDAIRTC